MYREQEECLEDVDSEDRRKEMLGRPKRIWEDKIIMDLTEI
jgi:hypothetical protein